MGNRARRPVLERTAAGRRRYNPATRRAYRTGSDPKANVTTKAWNGAPQHQAPLMVFRTGSDAQCR